MLSIGINPFMKKLESFFRYLWIFSRKEKTNLKEPSELLTILKIRLFINDIIFRIYLVKFSEREREILRELEIVGFILTR